MLHHHRLSFIFCFPISHCLFLSHTQHHTPYFISPCVSALSRDYNVVSHYTLWALCQCSRRPKLPKSSDFCHVGTAQLDNWRWKVQIFTLPPSLCLSHFNLVHPHSLSHSFRPSNVNAVTDFISNFQLLLICEHSGFSFEKLFITYNTVAFCDLYNRQALCIKL